MHRPWIRLLGALFALTLLAAACGGDDPEGEAVNGEETPTESPTETDEGGGADLTIVDFSFSPADLSVTEGQTISVTNIGETSHTFTTDDDAIDETIGAGDTVEITLTGVSSGGFHCRFHSQMTGALTVG
jgi:plastocyanin